MGDAAAAPPEKRPSNWILREQIMPEPHEEIGKSDQFELLPSALFRSLEPATIITLTIGALYYLELGIY